MSLMTGRFFLLFAQVVVAVNTFKGCSQPLMSGLELLRLFLGEIKGFPEVWLRFWLLLAGLLAAGHASLWLIPTTMLGFAGAAALALLLALVGITEWFSGGLAILLSSSLTLISQGIRCPKSPVFRAILLVLSFLALDC